MDVEGVGIYGSQSHDDFDRDDVEQEIVIFVENILRLESSAIGEIVGVTMLPALVDRMDRFGCGDWMG
ncbi:hypothetical protein K1719_041565 [Acacia pycnantha]|nr:hypothetical protein K1719_041565 [Acacia pycnantha]